MKLDEIRRRCEAATEGPWRYVPWHVEEGPSAVKATDGSYICTTSNDATAAFIAHAPTDIPDLLSLIDRCKCSVIRDRDTYPVGSFDYKRLDALLMEIDDGK